MIKLIAFRLTNPLDGIVKLPTTITALFTGATLTRRCGDP